MNKTELLNNLEYWADCLENPAYCSLETGFRHRVLTKDEIIERYKQECYMTRQAILKVIEIIEEKGVT
jgi:hypothetical protein